MKRAADYVDHNIMLFMSVIFYIRSITVSPNSHRYEQKYQTLKRPSSRHLWSDIRTEGT